MSLEAARAFVERMKTDIDFGKEISSCKDKDTRIAMVKEAGFDFTIQELEAIKRELTEEQLETLAGAGGQWCRPCSFDIFGIHRVY